jgi:1-hydroxycarotenoid 3,4-desaturase
LDTLGADVTGKIVIIGAGIAGLAAALRLGHAGCDVTVIETQATPGGKMRQLPTAVGPVDAGPTVLTMRGVFDALFADIGQRLEDHVTLTPLPILARHYWDDGTVLDLMADPALSLSNIADSFGPRSAAEFNAFCARTKRLFDAFDAPMMQQANPDPWAITRRVLARPGLIRDMAPLRSLAGLLRSSFSDPRLAQLFGRYATYVGGSPYQSPAILSLIWQAEAQGVWSVSGGMHQLAQAMARLAGQFGVQFHYQTQAVRITRQGGQITGVETTKGHFAAPIVLFNGDPRALATGLLGPAAKGAVSDQATAPRSLSAYVHAFAAVPHGVDLAHHTVFFGHDPRAEFASLAKSEMPTDATLYLCAQDHGQGAPDQPQRFEIIMNAPAGRRDADKEKARCQTVIFNRFRQFGLSFSPEPDSDRLMTPQWFDQMFPASQGALYGQSPHGLMAAFRRPTARSLTPGLYLAGGGAHPGAGVPMATRSGLHAAAAILTDLALQSTSRQVAMPGGISTGSAIAAPKPSASSGS